MSNRLPDPRLTKIFRLEATLGKALDVGNVGQGRRRIVPLIGGTFVGPELSGRLLPEGSADWQTVLPDGTALGDIEYTLQTDGGALMPPNCVECATAVLRFSPLGRGEDVDASEYTFRTSTPDRDGGLRSRLAEQGRVRERRRTPT